MTAPMQQKQAGNPYYRIQRQPCQNNSSTNTIPAFGLVRVVGATANGVLLVDQPSADGQDVFVNGPIPIGPNNGATPTPEGGMGVVSKAWPIFAAYDTTSGTPAIGDAWGAASGSYLLKKGKPGFLVQAPPVSADSKNGPPRVLIAPGLSMDAMVSVNPNTGYSTISLGRTITGANLSGTTIYDPTANFIAANDNGATVTGTGIPASTTITVVDSQHATTSNPLTTGTNISVGIIQGAVNGYPATIQAFHGSNPNVGTWTAGSGVWFYGPGGEASQPGRIYPAHYIGNDYAGTPIYSWTPGCIICQVNNATRTGGYYDASLVYWNGIGWTVGPKVWLMDANG